MYIKKYINSIFSSNTYLLYKNEEKDVWVIDPGDSCEIIRWIETNNKKLKGILLTHSHFDHIYGVNDFYEKYPNLELYASDYAKEGLFSSQANGSLYKEIPFVVNKQYYRVVAEGDTIQLWANIFVKVFETPGHGRDSLSFEIGNNLFTGDALIPGIKVFTKMKYGNKQQAEESIKRIFDQFCSDTVICPGHADMILLKDINVSKVIGNKIKVT